MLRFLFSFLCLISSCLLPWQQHMTMVKNQERHIIFQCGTRNIAGMKKTALYTELVCFSPSASLRRAFPLISHHCHSLLTNCPTLLQNLKKQCCYLHRRSAVFANVTHFTHLLTRKNAYFWKLLEPNFPGKELMFFYVKFTFLTKYKTTSKKLHFF